MPKIDVSKLPSRQGSPNYPPAFQPVCAGRHKTPLGNAAGITQFGVNLTRLEPGAATSVRHWHENEDEFVFILMGECVLIENEGETILKPGDAAGFKAGVANAHTIVNRSQGDVVLIEVGTRAPVERAHYPGEDLKFERDGTVLRVLHRDGTPY
ncbi:MAG: cupin domain-containing protein [Proteobacteria bacterium]|nr:cupin domain-containing protein [Pseudomonadota bacterium]